MEDITAQDILDSYQYGQIKQAKQQLAESALELYEVLDHWLNLEEPHNYEIVSFVRIMMRED